MPYIDYHISNRLDILKEIKRINRYIEKELSYGYQSNPKTIRALCNHKKSLQKELEALIS